MKLAKKGLALALAGTMLTSLLPGLAPAVEAADERAALTASRGATAPVIDGSLDESMWRLEAPIDRHLSGEGADQLEAQMGMMWDNKYLYIGVQTTDPTLAASPGLGQDPSGQTGDYWWDYPNVTLFIDPTLHQSSPFAGKDVQLGFVYKPDTTTPFFSFGSAPTNTGRDEKSILRAIETTDSGWNLEVAVPWSFLDLSPQDVDQLGLEATVSGTQETEDGTREVSTKVWSAYNSSSFWNDTSGYGVVTLDEENPLTGSVSDVLLEEDFSSYADGDRPFGWIDSVTGEGKPFRVEGGRLVGDAHGSGQQSRIFAPVQWDDYVIEADVQFDSVLNSARWLSLMFRAPSGGLHPYNQMAIRQSGAFEIALRNAQNGWDVPHKGTSQPLELDKEYTLKVRVVGNNVKEYIKAADNAEYELLMDQTMDSFLLERGKVGFQIDQGKMSVSRLKVTRVAATGLDLTLPAKVEALTGSIAVESAGLTFSDGLVEAVDTKGLKWTTSDENVVRIVNNELVPLQEGTATVTATYDNVSATRQIHVAPSLTGKQVTSLTHDSGYALATIGEALDLSELTFGAVYSDYSEGDIRGSELSWQMEAADAEVADGKLIAKRSGIIRLTGESDGASVVFLLVAKAADAQDYVLYEQDFSGVAEGALPEGWRIIENSAAAIGVKDGALELNALAQPARVLLPQELDIFGDYRIDISATHVRANDTARWHSIMYRVQNGNYPYYQMAVRQGATAANGVEFAERTPQNAWNVIAASSYTSAIQADQMYKYTVKAHGDRVQQLINDELVTHTAAARNHQKGGVGLQANGSIMKVESVRVALQLDQLPSTPEERMVSVAEPATSISIAPTVVAAFEGAGAELALNQDKLPATAMLHVNRDLEVISGPQGRVLQPLETALATLNDKVMPALYVHDAETVTKLVDYLKAEGMADAFIVSNQPALVKQARTEYPVIRGIIDFPNAAADLSNEQLMEIRKTTNANLAKIALLPERAASQTQVEYLQARLVTVWAKHEGTAGIPAAVSHHKLITAGVNGIVTQAPAVLIDALALYNQNTTLIRKPLMVGHRGIPGLAPENTIEGAILSYEKGADAVENDIYITKDNRVVVMHDTTLDRTTNGTGLVEDYTWEELQKFVANKQFPEEYPDARIPLLDEYFEYFKETDLVHFVEVKTYNPAIIDPLVELIEKYDVEDQVVIISFSADQIRLLNEKLPGMSQGFLTGGYANENDVNGSIYRVLNVIQPLNSTFNTSFNGLGEGFLEGSKHRGITLWPWTYRTMNDFTTAFLRGTYGLTTDFNHWAADWPNLVNAEQERYELKVGDKTEMKVDVRTYTDTVEGKAAEIVVLSGDEYITVEDSQVAAKAAGTAYVTLRYTSQGEGAPVYDLYTQPVAIEVKSSGGLAPGPGTIIPGPVPEPEPEPEPNPEPGTPSDGGGIIKVPAIVDEQGTLATAEVDAERWNEQLEQAVAGANGIKSVRIEVGNSGEAGRIQISLPAGALSQTSLSHRVEVVTAHGTIELPSNAVTAAAGEQVYLTVERLDNLSVPASIRGQVGIRPVVSVELTDRNERALTWNGQAKVKATIPYSLSTEDQNQAHTLVVYAIDAAGQATLVPNARYDSTSGTIRGVLDQLGTYAVAQPGIMRFDDLSAHIWAKTQIEALAARQVILGIGEHAYGPASNITRADFVTLLVRALRLQGSAADNFSDVSSDAYYFEPLGVAKSLGLIEGQGENRFNPRSTITRQEMFTIVARAMDKLDLLALDASTGALDAFHDAAQVADYAKDGMAGLVAAGLVEGDAGTIRPRANATRAETAVFLYRLMNKAYE